MRHPTWIVAIGIIMAALLAVTSAAQQPKKIDVLRVGNSDALTATAEPGQEETAKDTFRKLIKEETGFASELIQVDNHEVLGEQLAGGKVHLGVFLGYEFAWAQAERPKLTPLAIGINTYPYHYAHLVVNQKSAAADFAGLQKTAFGLPRIGMPYLRLWLDRECQAQGKTADAYFGRVVNLPNVEDVLDELVDGKLDAAVVDRVGLETYRRRKPGRASQLKELLQSAALLPALVAFHEGSLDQPTRQRFLDGLLRADKKKDGQMVLNLFRLSSFQTVPKDFHTVVADSLKKYPPPAKK